MKRVDILLVEQGMAPSRTAAQHFIEDGRVSYELANDWVAVSKPSLKLVETTRLQVESRPEDQYVSRGALKLKGALALTGLDLTGKTVLDVGQSTGGFTDCALQAGAKRVVGVDVGHDQLAQRLREDPRVCFFEGVNARALDAATLLAANDHAPFDVMVCDVSFISLSLILPSALPLLGPNGVLLSLVKPQFEVGKEGIGKGGIVRDPAFYPVVQRKISDCLADLDFMPKQWMDSPIKGGDGNREFFVFAHRCPASL